MTREELELCRRAVRALDCGVHYCRYCAAGTKNRWQHDPNCPYEISMKDYHEACLILDRELWAIARAEGQL